MDNGSYSLSRVKREDVSNEETEYADNFDDDEFDLELEGEEHQKPLLDTQQEDLDDLEEDIDETNCADIDDAYEDHEDNEDHGEEEEEEPTVDPDDEQADEIDDDVSSGTNNHEPVPIVDDTNVWTLPKEKVACTLDEIRRGQTINKVAPNECPVIGCGKKINRANPEAAQGTISSGLKTHVIFVHYNSKKQTKKRKNSDSWNGNRSTPQSFTPTSEKRPMSSSSLYSVLAGLTQQQSASGKPNSSTNSLSHLKASLLDMKTRPSSGQIYESYDAGPVNNMPFPTNGRTISSDRTTIEKNSERRTFCDRYPNDRTQNDEPDPTHALNAFIKIICRRTGSNIGPTGIAEARKIIDKFTTSLISSSQTIADHYLTPPNSLYPGDIQQRPEVSPSDIVLAYKMLQKS